MKNTNIELQIFNYGYGISHVAKFSTFHDALFCMKAFNETLIKSHKCLPENIFYFVSYKIAGVQTYAIDTVEGLKYEDMLIRKNKVID